MMAGRPGDDYDAVCGLLEQVTGCTPRFYQTCFSLSSAQPVCETGLLNSLRAKTRTSFSGREPLLRVPLSDPVFLDLTEHSPGLSYSTDFVRLSSSYLIRSA